MKLKCEPSGRWRFVGTMWLIVAVLNVGLLLTVIDRDLFLTITSSMVLFLSILLSFAYFGNRLFDYVRLDDGVLSIDRGFPFPRRKIMTSDVVLGRVTEGKLVLSLKNETKDNVLLKNLSEGDQERLLAELEKYFPVE